MKYFIKFSLLILLLTISCQSNNGKKVIKNFISTFFVVKNKEIKINDLQNYISYNKLVYNNLTIEQKRKLNDYINFMINIGYQGLKKNNFKYKIYSSNEINPNLISHFKIKYPDKTKIYYIVSENKLSGFFILDKNNKIISFFSRDFMSQDESSVEPFIFTSENHINSLFKTN